MVKVCVALVVAVGCQGNAREPAPVRRADLPCTPVVHEDAGARRGPPLFEAYKLLGASADGKRIALMLTHMGPGSGQPVGGVHVREAGTAKDVLAKNYFSIQGTEADLPKVEHGITTELAGDIAGAGVDVGAHVPQQQAWCADRAGTIYTTSGAYELRVTHAACPAQPAQQSVSWQLCTKDGAHCVSGAPDCIDGQVSVHDLVRAGDMDWVIVDVEMKPFVDQTFHLFQAAGGSLTGS